MLFIPSSLFSGLAYIFLGIALLFALLAGVSLRLARPRAGQAPYPRHTYSIFMGLAVGLWLLLALVAHTLAY